MGSFFLAEYSCHCRRLDLSVIDYIPFWIPAKRYFGKHNAAFPQGLHCLQNKNNSSQQKFVVI